jgi:hypothetical protein
MLYGFIYLVMIMDWLSRYPLAWEISTSLDTAFCFRVSQKALGISKPDIFNTDGGQVHQQAVHPISSNTLYFFVLTTGRDSLFVT